MMVGETTDWLDVMRVLFVVEINQWCIDNAIKTVPIDFY
jgi:hypothetical protein